MRERCQEKNEAYVEKWSTISLILHPLDFAPASDGLVFGRKTSECGRLRELFSACSALLLGWRQIWLQR
jgi:hypothetical protein